MQQSVCWETACQEVERVARRELSRQAWRHDDGLLVIEPDANSVRWRFLFEAAPMGGADCEPQELAQIDCRLHPHDNVMWIGDLSVSPDRRRRGWARRLVHAAEGVARAMGCEVVVVFPLVDSMPFWRRLGYRPHPRKARVLRKSIAVRQDSDCFP